MSTRRLHVSVAYGAERFFIPLFFGTDYNVLLNTLISLRNDVCHASHNSDDLTIKYSEKVFSIVLLYGVTLKKGSRLCRSSF
jgi:hypothetical protein